MQKREPSVGEFWVLGNKVGFLDEVVDKLSYKSAFYIRGGDFLFGFDTDCFDKSIRCGGQFKDPGDGDDELTLPFTEQIQAWIDEWGVPKTFKGQPEYPLENRPTVVKKSAKKVSMEEELDLAKERVLGLEELKSCTLELASATTKTLELREKVKALSKKYLPRARAKK